MSGGRESAAGVKRRKGIREEEIGGGPVLRCGHKMGMKVHKCGHKVVIILLELNKKVHLLGVTARDWEGVTFIRERGFAGRRPAVRRSSASVMTSLQ